MENKQKLIELLKKQNNKQNNKPNNMEITQFNSKERFITEQVEKLLNDRIKLEYHNSQAYHALGVNADRLGMFGLKKLMHKQGHDEHGHATRLIEYITDMGGVAIIPMVEQMSFEVKSIDAALEKALELEIETTKQYTILYKELFSIGDFLTLTFIQWYLEEQKEELKLFRNLLDRWNSLGRMNPIVFDKELEEYA